MNTTNALTMLLRVLMLAASRWGSNLYVAPTLPAWASYPWANLREWVARCRDRASELEDDSPIKARTLADLDAWLALFDAQSEALRFELLPHVRRVLPAAAFAMGWRAERPDTVEPGDVEPVASAERWIELCEWVKRRREHAERSGDLEGAHAIANADAWLALFNEAVGVFAAGSGDDERIVGALSEVPS